MEPVARMALSFGKLHREVTARARGRRETLASYSLQPLAAD
jgi:hypothetical protein